MTIATTYPNARTSLLLDFANEERLDPRITFTRASTATYYDGKTSVVAEQNLLTYSQDYTQSAWIKLSTTVTGNSASAPDGTTTANLITASAGASGHDVSQVNTTIPASTPSTYSVYVKAGTYGFANIVVNGASSTGWYAITVNLTAGTITQTGAGAIGTYTSSSITSVGSSWYRVTLTGQMTQASNSVNIYLASSATPTYAGYGVDSWTALGTETIYAWGAQLEQRSSVTAYNPTTTTAITNYIPVLGTVTSGTPRFDHDPIAGTSLGLLIEEQRTNLLTYSDDFSNAAWVKTTSSVAANTIVAPDGTLTGDKFIDTAATTVHYMAQTATTTAAAYTFSVYAKAGELGYLVLYQATVASGCVFNLLNGTVGVTIGTPPTSTAITSVGNGWYRCAITITATAASNDFRFYLNNANSTNTSYLGNGYEGVYIWGAQLEAGSFATSYIPTTSAQVTRSADSASMTGTNFSSWYRADEGTLYTQAIQTTLNHAVNVPAFSSIDDGTANSRIQVRGGGGTFNPRMVANSTSILSVAGSTITINTPLKSAIAYKSGDSSSVANGTILQTSTTIFNPISSATLYIGIGNTSSNLCGPIAKVAFYPKRLTNAELQGLTT